MTEWNVALPEQTVNTTNLLFPGLHNYWFDFILFDCNELNFIESIYFVSSHLSMYPEEIF